MSRHREPDLSPGTATVSQLEAEAWLLDTAVPDALGAELLARSDTAIVYRVVGQEMASVVVKIVHPDLLPALRSAFARAGAHAALVPLLGSGVEHQLGFAILPHYARTLADRIEAGPIPLGELGALLSPIADALDQLHRAGLVHADVKPSNIMLTAAGNAVLADLDEAGELGAVPRRVTIGFCPPEQVTGLPLAVANDTYAFASTVLTALIGDTGWLADPPGWLASAAAAQLPAAVLDALRTALSRNPASRSAPPQQLIAALTAGQPPAAAASQPVPSTNSSLAAPTPMVPVRQVLAPVPASAQAAPPPVVAEPVDAPPDLEQAALAAAAHQVWGFVDLRAVTANRLALQLQPPEPEPEAAAAERPVWRHPAMIVSLALAAVLIIVGIVLTLLG